MTTYIVRRVLVAIPVFLAITAVLFFLVRMTPGDPLLMLLDPEMTAGSGDDMAYIEARRVALGLDKPVALQYVTFVGELVQGNLGVSIRSRQPVTDMLMGRLVPTLILMGSALAVALVVGLTVGIVAAVRKNSAVDYAAAVFSLGAISVPNFFLGLAGIYVFALQLGWLPSAGMGPPGPNSWTLDFRYLLMPATILGLSIAGPLVRYVRSGLLDELGKDYVRTAIFKGVTRRRAVVRHALRNSLIPLITVVMLYLPGMLSGAVIIEQIFAWPGMGTLAISSIRHRDYPVILGFTVMVSIAVLLANLIADILYAVVDPRVRYRR